MPTESVARSAKVVVRRRLRSAVEQRSGEVFGSVCPLVGLTSLCVCWPVRRTWLRERLNLQV